MDLPTGAVLLAVRASCVTVNVACLSTRVICRHRRPSSAPAVACAAAYLPVVSADPWPKSERSEELARTRKPSTAAKVTKLFYPIIAMMSVKWLIDGKGEAVKL